MINIVNVETHCDDLRMMTCISIKFKSVKMDDEELLISHSLVATVSAAFHKTTLLTDEGESLQICLDPKRHEIVDFSIKLKPNTLKWEDVSNFINALQRAIDDTKLF